jgi:hypothetical protein
VIQKRVHNLSQEECQEIGGSGAVFLVGSAISAYYPTNLPTGFEIVKKNYEYIFKQYKNCDWLRKEFSEMPFEALNECFPFEGKLPQVFKSLFTNVPYNDLHKCLAKNLMTKKISAIITPNYDMAIDRCLADSKSVIRMWDTDSCADFNRNKKRNATNTVYFKIHGSIDKTDSIIFLLTQERTLDHEKDRALQKLLANRILVIAGYSGRDFDICSLISNQEKYGYKKIYWLKYANDHKEEELSAYADHLLQRCKDTVIVGGSILELLNTCFNQKTNLEYGLGTFNAENVYQLDEISLAMWRIKILNRLSCAKICRQEMESNRYILDQKFYLEMLWDIYGSTGEYKKSIQISRKLLSVSKPGSAEYQLRLSTISGQLLSYNSFLSSYLYLYKAKRHLKHRSHKSDISPDEKTELLNRISTFWTYLYKSFPFVKYFKVRALGALEQLVAPNTYSNAQWVYKQGIKFNLSRLKLSNIEIPSEAEQVLESKKAYRNLGLPAYEINAYRDELEKLPKKQLTQEEKNEFNKYITKAFLLGKYPEIWKLHKLRVTKFQETKEYYRSALKIWLLYLNTTEYSLFGYVKTRIDFFKARYKRKL